MHTFKEIVLAKVKLLLENICVIKQYNVQFHGLYEIFMKGKCFQLKQVNQIVL